VTGLLAVRRTGLAPDAFVARHARVFRRFDAQDSGNVSYGVEAGGARFFVKTAGSPHGERIARLRNAVRLRREAPDCAMPALRNVVESRAGPLLVYAWAEGEVLWTPAARRADPRSPFARFVGLPAGERVAALDAVFRLHVALAARGWVACDFYDGCLLYDFAARRMRVIDLDHYHRGPCMNATGRRFGSTRFLAPEERVKGARIDERTTVFALGRAVQQLLPPGPGVPEGVAGVAERACRPEPAARFGGVAALHRAWAAALAR